MNRTTHRLRTWALALASVAFLAASAQAAETGPTLLGVVNVNTASAQELQLLPGIGEARAREVVALRKRRGGTICGQDDKQKQASHHKSRHNTSS